MHNERTHFLYVQNTGKGLKFCYQLNENEECLDLDEKKAEELTQKLNLELKNKFESCQKRTGNAACTCDLIDLGIIPDGSILTIESADSGAKFNAENQNGESLIDGEQAIDVPFCVYNLDTKGEESGKVELRKYETDDPSQNPPFRHNDKPVLINSGGKVCIAIHDMASQYSYDENQGSIFTPNLDVVIQSECLYPLLDNNPSIV